MLRWSKMKIVYGKKSKLSWSFETKTDLAGYSEHTRDWDSTRLLWGQKHFRPTSCEIRNELRTCFLRRMSRSKCDFCRSLQFIIKFAEKLSLRIGSEMTDSLASWSRRRMLWYRALNQEEVPCKALQANSAISDLLAEWTFSLLHRTFRASRVLKCRSMGIIQ